MIKEHDRDKLAKVLAVLQRDEKDKKHKAFSSFLKELEDEDVTLIMSKKRRNLVDFIVYKEKKMKLIWFNESVYVDYLNGSREHSKSFINGLKKKEVCVD
jgi:hypothetical protein